MSKSKGNSAKSKSDGHLLEEELIERASMGMQELPMLDVIFNRMATVLNGVFKSRAALLVEISPPEVNYSTWGKTIEAAGEHAVYGVVEATPWDGNGLIVLNQDFFFAMTETWMNGTPVPGTAPNRGPSSIERRLARRIMDLISEAMSENFTRLTEVQFKMESVETPQQVSSLQGANTPCATVKFGMKVGDCEGFMQVVFPMTTLDPAQKVLSKMFLGEKLGGDGTWRETIMQRISGSSVSVAVVLREMQVDLGEIIDWKPGQTIDLGIDDTEEATVVCSGIPIFYGVTGRKRNDRIALRVTREADDMDDREEEGVE